MSVAMHAWIVTDAGGDLSPSDRISTQPCAPLPDGFQSAADGSVSGRLEPETRLSFTFRTDEYERDWNVRTDVIVRFANEAEDEEA